MNLNDQAIGIIENAEHAVAALATEAAARRDYGGAASLMAAAQRIADAATLLGVPRPTGASGDNGETGAGLLREPLPHRSAGQTFDFVKIADAGVIPPNWRSLPENSEWRPEKRTKSTRQYPRFKREGDETLVKVGWSKSEHTTYEHRSPRTVAIRLVQAVERAGAGGARFSTEDVLPLRDEDGKELPSYQAYLCLAWLVASGILEKHGRQGYTVADTSADLDKQLERAWAALPTR